MGKKEEELRKRNILSDESVVRDKKKLKDN